MSKYTDYDIVLIEPEGELWKLAAPLYWDIGTKGSKYTINIPTGFVFDGPTIPWWARTIFKQSDGRWWKASAVHDYLLTQKDFSKATAAAEFYNALVADGVCKTRAKIALFAIICHTLK